MKNLSLTPYRLLLVVSLLVFHFSLFAQNGFTNKAEAKNLMVKGKKEGKWCEYFNYVPGFSEFESPAKDTSTADYYCLTYYKKGKPIGIKRWYGKNGIIQREITFDGNSRVNGLGKEYYKSGKIRSETMFKNGISEGFDREYYENGKLKSEIVYGDNKPDSVRNYDGNGNEIKLQ